MALGLGMATDKNDRDSLMGWRVASNCFVNCLIAPFLMSAVYRTSSTFGTSNTTSLALVGGVLGLLILVSGLAAAKLVREPAIIEHGHGSDHGLIAGFKASLTSIPFLMVTAIVSLTVIGLCAAASLGMYLNLTIVYPVDGVVIKTLDESKKLSADMVGISGSIGAGVALVFAFMVAPLSKRFGRKPVLLAALFGIIGTFVCSPLLYTKAMPSLQILFNILNQVCVTCVWVLTLPMLADVCDYDEIKNGVRREGVFTAMYNWGIKVAISMIGVCGGLAITYSGFNAELVNQAPRTAEVLRWVFALGPVPFFIACIILTITFPLTPEKIQALREQRELESRRLKAAQG
jgi:GPH family glycoside/pentoside/hexuronide:cation symporter